jgi:hypothetical protein
MHCILPLQYYPELVPVPYDLLLTGTERSDLWRVLVLNTVSGLSTLGAVDARLFYSGLGRGARSIITATLCGSHAAAWRKQQLAQHGWACQLL